MAPSISTIIALLLCLGFLLWDRRRLKDRAHAAERRLARVRRKFDALSAQQRFLDRVLNAIGDPIFVKDAQHRFIYVNDAQCRLSGRARWEVVGKRDGELFPKERVNISLRGDDRVLATGQENIYEEQITDAAGALRTILTKKAIYVDREGRRYVVGISYDITPRKQAAAESARRNAASVGRVPERVAELTPPNGRQAEAIAERMRIGAALRRYDDDAARAAPTP